MVSRIHFDRSLPLAPPALARRVADSVRAASLFTPRATCLVQAVAAKILLEWRGFSSQIEVGVRKNGAGFDAHAWLTTDGMVVLGGDTQSLSDFHAFLKIS